MLDRDGVFKLELENEDNGFLHGCIFGKENRTNPETPSQKRLRGAIGYFEKELSNHELERLERIFDVSTNADILLYGVLSASMRDLEYFLML